VYLPRGYDSTTEKRYPVLYLLHGFLGTNRAWSERYRLHETLDELIHAGKIQPLIVVMPDARNRFGGNAYANSPVTGNWEDFFTRDLIAYIDGRYRTLSTRASRGIAGHSSGAGQALKWALRHPDLYAAVYALSPANVSFDVLLSNRMTKVIQEILSFAKLDDFDRASFGAKSTIATAAAISPNSRVQPFLADLPYAVREGTVVPVPSVIARWMEHDLTRMVGTRASSLEGMAIRLDVGDEDPLVSQILRFQQALVEARVVHRFELYAGNHGNRIRERLREFVLPFFSEALDSRPAAGESR
jgi:enterochelin esterase-like enzyme